VIVPGEALWQFLDAAAMAELGGGRVYDALMAEAATLAGVDILLSWNARHYRRWPMTTTRVLSPRDVLAAGSLAPP
jgi:hypothetical protein